MANLTKTVLLRVLVLILVLCFSWSDAHSLKYCKFDQIYQLGDSISDTGNLILENPNTRFSHLPYGKSLPKALTGRCSNGLLMIDYFALDARHPLLNPYLNKNASKNHGVNFAVAGATALPFELLLTKNLSTFSTNSSLDHQLSWMLSHFSTICQNQIECRNTLRNALFIVGEIGGNDYNFALLMGRTFQEIKDMVPDVVQTIKRVVEKVISHGATRVIIPGNIPIGCFPLFLTIFQTNDTTAYDEFRCLKDLNALAIYHNHQIKRVIRELRKENPHTIILYGDYYNAFRWILRRASNLGFDEDSLQKSCCGIGGDYNFDLKNICGPEVPVCPNPNDHISWDGVHLTQNAYKFMAHWLIDDIVPKLRCIV
ncbi:acetylajmalan esterase-like [Cucurbita moschata]|uniref:Acetylajmalan esterase-like n=1 Tax=Cucurbita moschata TaxID=3662 RepID=A0A6J1G566_CUCMO|nr:acetylajmalan esterase-like [Cucurbita moschata]